MWKKNKHRLNKHLNIAASNIVISFFETQESDKNYEVRSNYFGSRFSHDTTEELSG